jgi:ribonuclease VapC
MDASAVVAILQGEAGYDVPLQKLLDADEVRISPVSAVEIVMALARRYSDPRAIAETYLRRSGIIIHPIDAEQARLANDAFLTFGKGRHAARLNLGDCFSYALAKALGAPLLFVGGDFAKTDVRTA